MIRRAAKWFTCFVAVGRAQGSDGDDDEDGPAQAALSNDQGMSVWRVVNDGNLPYWWAIAEIEWYEDRGCTRRMTPEMTISSGGLTRGYLGVYSEWEVSKVGQPKPEKDYPVANAYDGNPETFWYSRCSGCRSWLGAVLPGEPNCVKMHQSAHARSATSAVYVQRMEESMLIVEGVVNASKLINQGGVMDWDPDQLKWRVQDDTDTIHYEDPSGEETRSETVLRGSSLVALRPLAGDQWEMNMEEIPTILAQPDYKDQLLMSRWKKPISKVVERPSFKKKWRMPDDRDDDVANPNIWSCTEDGLPRGVMFSVTSAPGEGDVESGRCPSVSTLSLLQLTMVIILFGGPLCFGLWDLTVTKRREMQRQHKKAAENRRKLQGLPEKGSKEGSNQA